MDTVEYLKDLELKYWNDLMELEKIFGLDHDKVKHARDRWCMVSDILEDLGIEAKQEGRL